MAYIDREKFLKKSVECFGHFGVLVKAIEEIANKCTEEDVVEVVRCKDCEFAYICGGKVYCRNIETPWDNDYFEVFTEITDFCSYGTPKERGGEK